MKEDNKGRKNSFLSASQKVVRNGLLRVFVIVLAKAEIRCSIQIHSSVPRYSTAVTCIEVLQIKQQLKPKLISTRFLPFIKLPKCCLDMFDIVSNIAGTNISFTPKRDTEWYNDVLRPCFYAVCWLSEFTWYSDVYIIQLHLAMTLMHLLFASQSAYTTKLPTFRNNASFKL